jgi:hypothetical protein
MRHVGREESSTWEVLREELHQFGYTVPVVRRLQEAAQVLRKQVPPVPVIGLSGGGVCIARDVDDIDAAIDEKRRRAISTLGELRTLKRIRLSMLGQAAVPGSGEAR